MRLNSGYTQEALAKLDRNKNGLSLEELKTIDSDNNGQISQEEAHDHFIDNPDDIALLNQKLNQQGNASSEIILFPRQQLENSFVEMEKGTLYSIDSNADQIPDSVKDDYAYLLKDLVGLKNLKQSTPQDRLQILEDLTQFDHFLETGYDQIRCAASCMVAGAFYQGSIDGVKALAQQALNHADTHQINGLEVTQLEEVQAKLQGKQPLNMGDLSLLQNAVFHVLKVTERYANPNTGLTTSSVTPFIESSPELSQYFSNMDILNVGQHAVLSFQLEGSGERAIYDPYPMNELIVDGQVVESGQVITDPLVISQFYDKGFDRNWEYTQVVLNTINDNYHQSLESSGTPVTQDDFFTFDQLGVGDPSYLYEGE